MNLLKQHKLVVIKLGSSILVDESGKLDRVFIQGLCDDIALLAKKGFAPIVVSSGAVAAGRERLGFSRRPKDLPSLQACAAAGQAALMEAYELALQKHALTCGQVLLTRRDVIDRTAYLNARNTLTRLLELGAIPVVNENDTVSVAEFTFGDNDMLGAIVASLVGAEHYIMMSDVDGLYTADPRLDPAAELISRVDHMTDDLRALAQGSSSSYGTGGMQTKLRAAAAMMAAGIPSYICRGREERVLTRLLSGEKLGTQFSPNYGRHHEHSRKLWIALADTPHGSIRLDAGAERALVCSGASILPVGITEVVGIFDEGSVVDVLNQDGHLLARGLSRYSSDELIRIKGLSLDVVERFLGAQRAQVALHRDDLLLL